MKFFPICYAGLLFTAILPQGLLAQAHIDEDKAKLTLYVDVASPIASDASAGTQASPLKTISAAVTKAGNQNARILIAPGDYREYITVPGGDNLLIFQASVPGKVIISGSDIYREDILKMHSKNKGITSHWKSMNSEAGHQ